MQPPSGTVMKPSSSPSAPLLIAGKHQRRDVSLYSGSEQLSEHNSLENDLDKSSTRTSPPPQTKMKPGLRLQRQHHHSESQAFASRDAAWRSDRRGRGTRLGRRAEGHFTPPFGCLERTTQGLQQILRHAEHAELLEGRVREGVLSRLLKVELHRLVLNDLEAPDLEVLGRVLALLQGLRRKPPTDALRRCR